VRFTTSHPRDFTPDIVQAIERLPALCDHVHLPVQSGSSRVLQAMLREYTRDQYLERIAWMKSARRDISLTTDIIVGFPGETEAEFEETLGLLEEVGYDAIFSFKYSPRPNTPALQYPDGIADAEKARRLASLQERQRAISTRNNHRHIDSTLEVMVEAHNELRGQWIGRTSQNKILNFTAAGDAVPGSGRRLHPGDYVNVRVTAAFPNSLAGELVS
jgi:tRNA-2-methylthio-N6-dimethylallyladenosine synthase